jgi:hypothetical protein
LENLGGEYYVSNREQTNTSLTKSKGETVRSASTSGMSTISSSTTNALAKQLESSQTESSLVSERAVEYVKMQTTMFSSQYQIEEERDKLISKRKVCNVV